jgi:hypothetical protein
MEPSTTMGRKSHKDTEWWEAENSPGRKSHEDTEWWEAENSPVTAQMAAHHQKVHYFGPEPSWKM